MIRLPCTCARLRRTARFLTGLYDEALAPTGLTVTQYSLLSTLAHLGPTHISALAERTGHERSTLGRNLRLLEEAGLVAFSGGLDQRTRLAAPTEAGHEAIARARPLWRAAEQRVADHLGDERRKALFALLDDIETLAG